MANAVRNDNGKTKELSGNFGKTGLRREPPRDASRLGRTGGPTPDARGLRWRASARISRPRRDLAPQWAHQISIPACTRPAPAAWDRVLVNWRPARRRRQWNRWRLWRRPSPRLRRRLLATP